MRRRAVLTSPPVSISAATRGEGRPHTLPPPAARQRAANRTDAWSFCMRIMFIAPQPFFQERGTPISIDLLLRELSGRGDEVDLLTYHLGEKREYEGVSIGRISPPFAPEAVKPGFSWKKVWCDFFLTARAVRAMRSRRYDLIHAVEEGAFIALLLGLLFRTPYVYDMDSSLAAQVLQRFPWLRPAAPLLRSMEALAMRRAIAVMPMCDALAEMARRHCRGSVHVLRDVSLITPEPSPELVEDLRLAAGARGPLVLYAGNLEPYQGIDLLLRAFARLHETWTDAVLVVIGGSTMDIERYHRDAEKLGIGARVCFLGPRPVSALGSYLRQADVLVSPRVEGDNTPLKLYSYLDSGVPVVATDMPTHRQVVSECEAALAPPEADAFAAAIRRLLDDPLEGGRLGNRARALIRRRHSFEAFHSEVERVFSELEGRLALREKLLVRLR